MAAAGIFTITELRRLGGKLVNDFSGERFAWSSDSRTGELQGTGLIDTVKVGAHAIPLKPWSFGGQLRTVRTDYAGAKVPSEQVLGPNHKPFTLTGRWSDKFNFPGFATTEMRRFEAMCFRGNVVRISFQEQSFDCLIKEWDFPYSRKAEISYSFSVSVHNRSDDPPLDDKSPSTARGATEHLDDASVVRDALESTNKDAPVGFMSTGTADAVNANLESMQVTIDTIDAQIEQRETVPDVMPTDTFQRLATQYRILGGNSFDIANTLRTSRSDTDLGAKTALGVLNFEVWTRGVRSNARVMQSVAQAAASELSERSESNAMGFYRPFRGESLYRVSEQMYGTPHAWRLIADRNRLANFILDGTELLIIPERGTA